MIKFFNNRTPNSIIDSATLTQEKIANYVVETPSLKTSGLIPQGENGILNETENDYFSCQMNWKHFLAMIRETMVEEEQWMDPNYMLVQNNDKWDVVVFLPIDPNEKIITATSGLIYLVPIMINTPDEDLITIKFNNRLKEKFSSYNPYWKFGMTPESITFVIIAMVIFSVWIVFFWS